MSLSGSACPMMLCVRDKLLNLHQVLSLPLFQLAWQGLAERLDHFLYQEVRAERSGWVREVNMTARMGAPTKM